MYLTNTFKKTTLCIFILAGVICLSSIVKAQTLTGRIELAFNQADPFVNYQSQGTGVLRTEDSGPQLQQALLVYKQTINASWTANAVANAYLDGEKHLGFTQAYLAYKPLSGSNVRFKSRLGFFYPALSVENTAKGWLSPYTYTQSAINSWIGEEMRVLGGEASLFSNGRKRRSPWSWEAHLGLYKGNDTFGTLLAWRSFAFHDRQSLHHDRVFFAPIPTVSDPATFDSPTWLSPFTEIDGKLGMYVGAHLSYLRKADIRYYFYDNRADPSRLNSIRLYAWRTKFHSLAYQHQLNRSWRLMMQIMEGATDMGPRKVYADFTARYIALNFKPLSALGKHQVTLRYDHFDVREDDYKPYDKNNNHGHAWTIAWRYQLSKQIELGAEWHTNATVVKNRSTLGPDPEQSQSQQKLVLSYTF